MRDALSSRTMSRLIGEMYDSALDPGRWMDTLTDIRTELGFANAALTLIESPGGALLLNIFSGPTPQWVERSYAYGADVIEQWGGVEKLRALPLDRPAILSQVRPTLWTQNRFYKEWGEPQGICDVMALPLTLDPVALGSLGMGRHKARGAIGDLEVEAATLLIPHLQRATAIGRLLDVKSVVSTTFDAVLDTLSVGVFLVDGDLRIIHANRAAREMLSADTSIAVRHGRLGVQPPAVEAGLLAAVRQAEVSDAAIGRRGFGIHSGSNHVGAVIHVLPLRHGPLRPGLAPDAIAAVFVATASEATRVPADALSALYDLTPAEVRVFAEIATGRTRAEAARALAIEPATVKAHLSHIFLKTGARRQADLVALNAAIALPLRD